MWTADRNVHWLARLAGAASGFASGRRGPHQASSAAVAIFPMEMENWICFLRCCNSLRKFNQPQVNTPKPAYRCWSLSISCQRCTQIDACWWKLALRLSIATVEKSGDRLFIMRRLSEYLHCQHEINSRTIILVFHASVYYYSEVPIRILKTTALSQFYRILVTNTFSGESEHLDVTLKRLPRCSVFPVLLLLLLEPVFVPCTRSLSPWMNCLQHIEHDKVWIFTSIRNIDLDKSCGSMWICA